MDRKTFAMLCELLRTHGRLKMYGSVAIEEQHWEGSSSNSRVLRDVISRPHGLKVIMTLWMLFTQIVRDFLHPTEERDITYRNGEKDVHP
ncbi:hypothetical protein L3X38_004637 [Prunus dulcis]|uniref:Uncharacterized protein n=1 Tax=Prunus dulcis TaxID=3755 RepID=A0AAD4ZPE6_PRUDU|nr:hypothetical protein L3X38_004637 [Prunus dulcis]